MTFRIDADGAVELPTKGDVVTLFRRDGGDAIWLRCHGRRFDLTASGGPALTIALESF
jgi:hypothetical protein